MLKLKGNYDEIHESIKKENIPKEWTYSADYTIYKILIAILEKYIEEADKMVILNNKDEIIQIIDELKGLENHYDEAEENYSNDVERIFNKIGKILPTLWW